MIGRLFVIERSDDGKKWEPLVGTEKTVTHARDSIAHIRVGGLAKENPQRTYRIAEYRRVAVVEER